MKIYQNFLYENFHFLVVKFSVFLNRHVFVMRLNVVANITYFHQPFMGGNCQNRVAFLLKRSLFSEERICSIW